MDQEAKQARIAELKSMLAEKQLEQQLLDMDANAPEEKRAEKEQRKAQLYKMLEEKGYEFPKPKSEPQTKQPSNDSLGDDTLDVIGELAAGFNQVALDTADMFTAPMRVTGEFITGKDVRAPSEVLEETTGFHTRGGFMDEGVARDAVRAAGMTANIGVGLKGVERGVDAANTLLDMAGLGSTIAKESAVARSYIAQLNESDWAKLGQNVETMSDDQLFEFMNAANMRKGIDLNRRYFDEYEQGMSANEIANQTLDVADDLDDLAARSGNMAGEFEARQIIDPTSIKGMIDEMAKFNVDPKRVLDVVRKRGGLKFDTNWDDMIAMDRQLNASPQKVTKGPGWYQRNFLPVADVIRAHANPQVGNMYERAVETATRYSDGITRQMESVGLKKVADLVEHNTDLKRLILDVGRSPNKMGEIQTIIKQNLGEEGLKAFNLFRRISDEQNGRAQKILFKGTDDIETQKFGDLHYFHTEKRVTRHDEWKKRLGRFGKAETDAPSALRSRVRGKASKMTDEELAEYQNPILTQLKHLSDQEQLLQIGEKFRLRPSLTKESNVEDFFNEMNAQLTREGLSESQAGVGKEMMRQAYMGAKDAPPAWIRAFMNTAYAGTLSQFKSAVLNFHDVAVAAVNQGGANTLRGLFKSTKSEFGKTLEELGMSQQSVGEFVRGFENVIDQPSRMDQVAVATGKFTDQAMKWSAFRKADLIGKGTVLRASVNRMRKAAQKGTLHSEFGDSAYRHELKEIQQHLQAGTKVKDMPENARRIVEEIAFTALGKQQLTSAAGRPLGYLKHPLLRPAYAMTGFAIKQQAMLKAHVLDELARGNFKEAGSYAARYVMFAGTGYALLNNGREYIFKGERDMGPEDLLFDTMHQITAALTLNRIGSSYDWEKLGSNPVEFLMQSFLPPGGLVEAAGEDLADTVKLMAGADNVEFPDRLAERFPVIGDFYKYHLKPRMDD